MKESDVKLNNYRLLLLYYYGPNFRNKIIFEARLVVQGHPPGFSSENFSFKSFLVLALAGVDKAKLVFSSLMPSLAKA